MSDLLDRVEIGKAYKVNSVNCGDKYYTVKAIKLNQKSERYEVTAKADSDAHSRTFYLEEILVEKERNKKVTTAKKIISEEGEVIIDFGEGVQLVMENVSYWPEWGARGRPRKVVA
jgi:dihydrodipicolinate reductase